jgi:hypothetical protein
VSPFSIHYGERRRLLHDSPDTYTISFSHYPWSDEDEGREMAPWDVRLHGHIHNNGYSRDAFVPFLKNHINLSVEQTKYRPVNLKLLLDAYLFGDYPETTQEQQAFERQNETDALKADTFDFLADKLQMQPKELEGLQIISGEYTGNSKRQQLLIQIDGVDFRFRFDVTNVYTTLSGEQIKDYKLVSEVNPKGTASWSKFTDLESLGKLLDTK